jgi:hypothetical protein
MKNLLRRNCIVSISSLLLTSLLAISASAQTPPTVTITPAYLSTHPPVVLDKPRPKDGCSVYAGQDVILTFPALKTTPDALQALFAKFTTAKPLKSAAGTTVANPSADPAKSTSIKPGENPPTPPLPDLPAAGIAKNADGKWVMKIPTLLSTDAEPVAVYKLTITDSNGFSVLGLSPFFLTVYPSPTAVVKNIYPSSPKVLRDQILLQFKIEGTGLYAPVSAIDVSVGGIAAEIMEVSPNGTWITAQIQTKTVKEKKVAGSQPVSVSLWSVPASLSEELAKNPDGLLTKIIHLEGPGYPLAYATGAFLGLILILFAIYSFSNWRFDKAKRDPKERRKGIISALLLEEANQTYSLSYFQFWWWFATILFAFLFIFFSRSFVENTWAYPDMTGFGYTFLISLGTLVAAQATNSAKGTKGAGEVHPSLSDLIVNGGVLAPERVQQLAWTLITSVCMLFILVNTYATATGVPAIPNELLVLMGISSAGYIGGKMARQPGPVIDQIMAKEGSTDGSTVVEIHGAHLSATDKCNIFIDEIEVKRNQITGSISDKDNPTDFATMLQVTLGDPTGSWNTSVHEIRIVNADGQRAVQQTDDPVILEVTPADPIEKSVTVTVTGQRIAPGATMEVLNLAEKISWVQQSDPNLWKATVPTDSSLFKQPQTFVVTNPNGKKGSKSWTPSVPANVGQSDQSNQQTENAGSGTQATDPAKAGDATGGTQTTDPAKTGDATGGTPPAGQAESDAKTQRTQTTDQSQDDANSNTEESGQAGEDDSTETDSAEESSVNTTTGTANSDTEQPLNNQQGT